jgi:hypothetical protein
VAAVGELETEYGDRIDFVIVPAEETARRGDEIEAHGFTALKHGLVGFGPDGEARVRMPGHQFGRAEIEAALPELMEP